MKYNRKYTPNQINYLKENEIFVFGSNLAGSHGGGAARTAVNKFGAIWGQGVGLQGQSYAIPTMHGGTNKIRPYVDEFIHFAKEHPEHLFLVTRIGCGVAAFSASEIAPLFKNAIEVKNIVLPKDFVEVIEADQHYEEPDVVGWNPDSFLDKYHGLMEEVKSGNPTAYYEVKVLRAQEFRNTIEIVNQGYYISPDGNRHDFSRIGEMMNSSEFVSKELPPNSDEPLDTKTLVEVVNEDCLEVTKRLVAEGYEPALLNMASRQNPGGGVTKGTGAQEETLFRRTNLFKSLYQYAPYAEQYGIIKSAHQYPLDRNFGGVFTPAVTYFRESESKGYALMNDPVYFAVISVAGINRPELTPDGNEIAPHLVAGVKNKIRTIFRLGLKNYCDSLVLGVLGCGAFRNPPRHISRLFHEVMDEPEFKNKYRRIVFAILEDHNSKKSHNPEGNFNPFEEEFKNMDNPEIPFDNKYVEDVLNWTLPGCQLLYRDTDFPFDTASLYEKLTLFRAGFFIDCSAKAGKLMKKTRFIIASAHSAPLWEAMPEDDDLQAWKLHVLHFNSIFKVMDIYKVGDKTQILLLHIPYKAIPLFIPETGIQFDFEGALPLNIVDIARKSFDTKMQMDSIPDLETEAWNERTFNLPGVSSDGVTTLEYVEDSPEVASLSQAIRKFGEDEDPINRP